MTDNKNEKNHEYSYKSDYESDWEIHLKYVNTFDSYEAMLIGMVYDSVSASVDGSKITDSYAATLAIERAARVVGKLPEGVTESVALADQGKAAFMDILRQKWIYPNANSQHNLDTKFRLWQLYSSVYGYMPMFYDWNISPSGYVGPDCWLWNPRNLVPQQGKVSIADMDYVTALTWLNKKALQTILDTPPETDDTTGKPIDDGWNRDAIKQLIDLAGKEVTDNDPNRDTVVDRNRTPQGKKKGICIATRYEAGDDGKWISFAPDHSCIEIRNLPNPHKNGRIPFVIKYSQPLFDSFYGLGDFQRAKPLQFARDGLTNFYFKGIKMNLIPPIIANANGVIKHTLDYREGAVMLETLPNSIRRLETSNAGLATYQAAQTNLTGSLLSLFGTQNASSPGADTLNPSQGKTPAAIGLYSDKEATRDGQERTYLESAVEELTDGFMSLVVNIGTEDIPVALFSKDIESIAESGLTDIFGIFVDQTGTPLSSETFKPNSTFTGGQLTVSPAALKGVEYRFNIKPGSTAKENKENMLASLERLVDNLGKFQNMFKDDPRYELHPDEIGKAFAALSDIPNASKFVTAIPGAPSPQEQQQQQAKQEHEMKLEQQQQASDQSVAAKTKPVSESLNYKDAPEDIKRQIEGQAGMQPSNEMSPVGMQAQQGTEPQMPNFVGGEMIKDPLVAKAAEHLGKL